MCTAIIIPAYNEAENIVRLIKQLRRYLPYSDLYVIDGNSVDETTQIVKNIAKKDRRVFLLEQKRKLGRGHAVLMGFKKALTLKNIEYLIELDADLSHQPKDVLSIIRAANSHTVIIASRYIMGAKIINWPAWRRRQSYWANWLIRLVLGLKLHDNTNGLRCYPREAAQRLVKHRYLSQGFMALSESAYLLKHAGFALSEIPSTFVDRRYGKSSAGYKELFNSLLNLFQIRIHS